MLLPAQPNRWSAADGTFPTRRALAYKNKRFVGPGQAEDEPGCGSILPAQRRHGNTASTVGRMPPVSPLRGARQDAGDMVP